MSTAAPAKVPSVIVEWNDVKPVVLERARDPVAEGRLARLSYEFTTADTVNGNDRVYPSAVIKPAVEVLNEKCKRGTVYGRNDHPDIYDPNARIPTMGDAATRVISVEMTNATDIKVTLDVLDNPHGKQLMSILNNGGNPGISQRAMAHLENASEAEKAAYGRGADSTLEICRFLRLVTFDVVSQPGFHDADEPSVTESKDEPMWKSAQEVKTAAPEIANALINEGKASVDTTKLTTEAVEAAKPTIVEEATKGLKDDLAKERETVKKLQVVAEAVKDTFLKNGIAIEQVTDAEMKRRHDEAAAKVTELTGKLKVAEEALATATTKLAEQEKVQKRSAALAAVQEKYGKDKHWKHIAEAVKDIDDVKTALEAAAKKSAEIAAIVAEAGGAKKPAAKAPELDGGEPGGGTTHEDLDDEHAGNRGTMQRIFG